jgi:hypothetical protein
MEFIYWLIDNLPPYIAILSIFVWVPHQYCSLFYMVSLHGANLNAVYKEKKRRYIHTKKTPYDIAIEFGSKEAAELLAKLGAHPYKE